VIFITDSNDSGTVIINIAGYGGSGTFEADVVSYIKSRIGSESGVGTITATKSDQTNTSV
jgi:hypothetical protein